MRSRFVLLLCAYGSLAFGYDSGGDQAACGRPYRAGRVYHPPCDLEKQSFCTSAGETYPWHAVKRFVKDNQGLMRRMYGDQRHGNVLRAELEDDLDVSLRYSRYQHQDVDENDVFPREDADDSEARYLRDDLPNDDVLKTKFVYSEEPVISIKLAGLKTPYFRPTTQRTTKATSAKQEEITEMTVTEAVDINTTTETTTEGTTSTRNDGSEEASSTTKGEIGDQDTNKSSNDSEKKDKVETMLFQDMEDEASKKKVFVNYKLKGINACPVKEEVVAPFWANNTRGEVLALLNMYPFEQYVHWEKCSFEHRQMYCRDGCRCEQQYRLHRLLAYDPNNECRGIFSDWFRFPSCCVCKCYDMPMEFRVTSRSPRYQATFPDE